MATSHLTASACNFKVIRPGKKPDWLTGVCISLDGKALGYKSEDGEFVPVFLVESANSFVDKLDIKIDF